MGVRNSIDTASSHPPGPPPTIKTSTAGSLYVGDEHGPIGQIARLEPPNEFVIRASDRVEARHMPALDLKTNFVRRMVMRSPRLHCHSCSKVLIANRGEIAIRVIRAAREMGIQTVAVYSELRPIRSMCDSPTRPTLLAVRRQRKVTSTLRRLFPLSPKVAQARFTLATASSENADFARAITAMGVAWIGPPPEAIDEMGDKVSSRIAAQRGGARSFRAQLSSLKAPTRFVRSATSSGGRSALRLPTVEAVAA